MNKIYIGIDPGIHGAMALLNSKSGPLVFDFDDGQTLTTLHDLYLSSWGHDYVALLERVHSLPKQGMSSTFKFATNFGQWIGRLEALGIPFDFVLPKTWQKEMFGAMPKKTMKRQGKMVVDTKTMSLERARVLFPDLREKLKLKKHDGRADALLVAEYCRRMDNR